jgi:Zn-dependent protease
VELSLLATVGWSAVAVVVACWLTVSFSTTGLTRLRAGWLGAAAMYVAFGCLFLSLFLRARGNDSLAGMIGFGFLLAFFSFGFVLATQRVLRALAGKGTSKIESATN